MTYILALETSTKNCSAAIFNNDILISCKEKIDQNYSHSEQLTIFIDEVMDLNNIKFDQLAAVSIGSGPGSYTGLRIGVSVAKGLCFALSIPLLSVCPLKAMAYNVAQKEESNLYCSMIDARRMEVYSSIYTKQNEEERQVKSEIITKSSYQKELKSSVLFFGTGAAKCKEFLNHHNARFLDNIYPSSKNMGVIAFKKFCNKDFEDIAYFEPKYLKDFIVKKK